MRKTARTSESTEPEDTFNARAHIPQSTNKGPQFGVSYLTKPMQKTFLTVIACCTVAVAFAQSPSSSFPRGSSQQNWQNPGMKSVLAKEFPSALELLNRGESLVELTDLGEI